MTKKDETKEVATPVDWAALMAEDAKEVATLEKGTSDKFSLKSGVLSWQGNPVPGNEMEVIIVSFAFERVMWGEKFEVGVVKPPTCFSLDLRFDDMTPHEAVLEPQAQDCTSCGMGRFHGSTPPQCKTRRRLMCLPFSDTTTPESIKDAEVGLLNIPVMSIKNWTNYVKGLSAHSKACWGVVTKVIVKADPKSQFKVYFEPAGELADDLIAAVHERITFAQAASLEPYDMTPSSKDEGEEGKAKY